MRKVKTSSLVLSPIGSVTGWNTGWKWRGTGTLEKRPSVRLK
jgi:hypothetical protein